MAEHLAGGEGYDVFSNFQGPFARHPVMARTLKVTGARLRLRAPRDSGGSFGVKQGVSTYIVLLCLASRKAGAPVKWVEDRLEHLQASVSATNRVTTIEAAVQPDGEILTWRTNSTLQERMAGVAQDHRIRRAISYMHTNMGTELDIDKLAVEACLSRAHFFKLFQQCISLTPNLYLNVLRMNAAFTGLTQTTVPLTTLSEKLGISAQSHFTRFFQQHAGVNPSQYRKVVDVHRTDTIIDTLNLRD